jgi:hypothetical protein
MIQRYLLPFLAAAALTAGAATAQTTGTGTTTTVTRSMTFVPIGLASSETAQVNLVNLASNPSSGTAASCTGSVSFLSAAGTAVGSATSFTITSGKTFSATLPYASTAASGRTVVRAVVTQTFTTGSSAAPCQLASSLETYDTATGVTHGFVTGPESASIPSFGR